MSFEKVYITNSGIKLEAKGRAGKPLRILKVEIGDGSLTDNNIITRTSLINKKLECEINSLSEVDNQTIINFILQQSKIKEGFYFREFGVIAEEPDTKEEVLYLYANAGNKAEFINDKTSTSVKDKIIDIIVKEDNTDNIEISINNTGVYVEKQAYMEKINSIENTISTLNNNLSTKSDIPTSRTLTLASTGWVQNETTEKYEYTIEDESITENDYIMIDVIDKEQEEVMANTKVDTANGSIKFTSEEQIDTNVELQVVIIRTKEVEA